MILLKFKLLFAATLFKSLQCFAVKKNQSPFCFHSFIFWGLALLSLIAVVQKVTEITQHYLQRFQIVNWFQMMLQTQRAQETIYPIYLHFINSCSLSTKWDAQCPISQPCSFQSGYPLAANTSYVCDVTVYLWNGFYCL